MEACVRREGITYVFGHPTELSSSTSRPTVSCLTLFSSSFRSNGCVRFRAHIRYDRMSLLPPSFVILLADSQRAT